MSYTFLGLPTPGPDRFLQAIDRLGDRLDRNVPPVFSIADLSTLPAGTLGKELVNHFAFNGFQPLTTGPRRKQLHDLVHVLTDYGTDPIGELEVQALMLGAKFFPGHIVLGLALLHLADQQHRQLGITRREILQRMRQAYDHGTRSTLDIDTWQPEKQWHLPLIEVRKMLNLLP
jgi:ubiquinone biosynthesis protein COQ4